jgi:BlaI family penicillinase repressor
MAQNQPTDFELELLKVLWDRGPSTAREVLQIIEETRPVGYTTILKMLQVMEKKEMVDVDRSERSHVYGASLQKNKTMRGLVSRFVDRTFDGAADALLLHLAEGKIDAKTLDQLENKIAELRAKEDR